jgi:circadian clock protein KaiC
MLTRQVDFLKGRGVTAMFTSLGPEGETESTNHVVASLIDTWLLVRTVEGNGEHNRMLTVLKSRGMAHSNQVREFLITERGVELADVYVGAQGVLAGSARAAQEAKESSDAAKRQQDLEQRRANLERQRQAVQAQVAVLWREFEEESDTVNRLLDRGATGREEGAEQRLEQGRLRSSDLAVAGEEAEQAEREPARS